MKASELRIGNWVTDEFWDSFKTHIKVESIDDKGINSIIQDDGNYPECAQRWIEPVCFFDQLKGIPLTPEILEKCGFEKRIINNAFNEYFLPCTPAGYKNEWILRYRDYDNNPGLEFAPKLDGSIHSFPCNSLHQLQNLYWCLVGEELEIKF